MNLMEAAEKGDITAIRDALEKGADVNSRDNKGMTALAWALTKRRMETIVPLIENGADIDARNNTGLTALMSASSKEHAEIVGILKNYKTIKKPIISSKQVYVICPNCGACYNTQMVISSILMKSPFMADMSSWTTKIICSSCHSEFGVSGSYNKVFGQPRIR